MLSMNYDYSFPQWFIIEKIIIIQLDKLNLDYLTENKENLPMILFYELGLTEISNTIH